MGDDGRDEAHRGETADSGGGTTKKTANHVRPWCAPAVTPPRAGHEAAIRPGALP